MNNYSITIDQLLIWSQNKTIHPNTGNTITYDESQYFTNIFDHYNKLLLCIDDRDPISMNKFWIEENNIKKIVYPIQDIFNIIIYIDNNNYYRCFEKETLQYFKTYNIKNHPVTMDIIPEHIFHDIQSIIKQKKDIKDFALDVFQYFTHISIFVDYELFLQLSKKDLLKFHFEVRDFWNQNFTLEQKNNIYHLPLFDKTNDSLNSSTIHDIQLYLLTEMEILLKCNKNEYKYMINYILLGALGIVIPKIKEEYPDFLFNF
jgi:hypothetical protein